MRADLNETDVNPDALEQFKTWFADAVAAKLPEPNAMTLATAAPDGRPSARVVLLKSFDEEGFVFYSNYESRKGRELAANPFAALVFHWVELERQVRVTGPVSRLTRDDSARYFRARPAGNRLGAWASQQSQVIAGRQVLDDRLRELEAQYDHGEIPLPPYWGGLRVAPETVEFWQGRPNRLHDRLLYTRQPDGTWRIERLSP